MSAQKATDIEGSIEAGHAEQVRSVLSTIVGAELADRNFEPDEDTSVREVMDEIDPVEVTLEEIVRGCRVGALRALDVGDLDLEGERTNASGPDIKFVHRPDEETPLKNKRNSERWNSVSEGVARVLGDYVDDQRIEVLDDHGRVPLISTDHGRMSRGAIRATLYRVTRPCWYGEECPHDRDVETCEATNAPSMSTCPSSRSPHDLRSGRLTYYRIKEVDESVVSDRMDASEEVLDKHYDRRSGRQKAEQRRSHLPDL